MSHVPMKKLAFLSVVHPHLRKEALSLYKVTVERWESKISKDKRKAQQQVLMIRYRTETDTSALKISAVTIYMFRCHFSVQLLENKTCQAVSTIDVDDACG